MRLNAIVSSTASDIGIIAARDVIADNTTRVQRNLLIDAGRDVVMSAAASASAGDVLIVNSGQNQTIAELSANNVALKAGANIVDANGSAFNVTADNLNIQAGGSVGGPDTGNGASSNDNAIDLDVETVAAQSEGLYLRKATGSGNLTVGHVDAVNVSVDVSRVQFADVLARESVLGMIPVLGPVVAFFWKANDRNLRIIEANLRDREATRRESWKVLATAAGWPCSRSGSSSWGSSSPRTRW